MDNADGEGLSPRPFSREPLGLAFARTSAQRERHHQLLVPQDAISSAWRAPSRWWWPPSSPPPPPPSPPSPPPPRPPPSVAPLAPSLDAVIAAPHRCPDALAYECVDGSCHTRAAVDRGACSLGCAPTSRRCADGSCLPRTFATCAPPLTHMVAAAASVHIDLTLLAPPPIEVRITTWHHLSSTWQPPPSVHVAGSRDRRIAPRVDRVPALRIRPRHPQRHRRDRAAVARRRLARAPAPAALDARRAPLAAVRPLPRASSPHAGRTYAASCTRRCQDARAAHMAAVTRLITAGAMRRCTSQSHALAVHQSLHMVRLSAHHPLGNRQDRYDRSDLSDCRPARRHPPGRVATCGGSAEREATRTARAARRRRVACARPTSRASRARRR